MKELDLLLTHYLDARYSSAPESERKAFEDLLGIEDPVLWAWLVEAESVSKENLAGVVRLLRSYR